MRIVETDHDRGELLAARLTRTLVLNGDGTDLEFLESENVGRSDVLVCVIDNDERNLLASLLGRQLGVPKIITINSNEVLEALREPLAGIVSAIRLALEQTPPELCADVAERGIVLTGGGALLRDIDRLISEETGLHVQVADDPLTCVARGGGRALELVDMHGNEFFTPE